MYNGNVEPTWSKNIQFSTILISIMSVYRLALKGILESCFGQGAWIWVSTFRKGKTEAKLEDFKMFDEASRGLSGALLLLWRMKARHFACIGALIAILTQGFETFSSQMVTYTDLPVTHGDPTPPPVRSESWSNIVSARGGGTTLMLSTKAAIHDGIMGSGAVAEIPLACKTASCIWPIFPSLAVCGGCTESFFTTSCDPQKGCSHSMPSGTSVHSQVNDPFNYHFRVAPSNGSATFPDNSSEAVISMFDIISAETSPQNNVVQAYQCGLWFCLKSYNVTVTNGVQTRFVTREWSRSELNAQTDEHFFVDIPPEMNAQQYARYSVPLGALSALRAFIDKLTLGNARTSQATDVVVHDTDWIQAIEAATKVDLSVWISRFAHSLTQHIQLTGTVQPNKNSDYNGMAYIMAPHVVVNWYWVVYPISLMFLAFVYFVKTIYLTARDQVCAWKTDSLPMLFCHVSSDIHEQVQDGMDMPGGLKRRVGSTEVELMRQHNGEWVFTRPRHH